MRWHTEKRKINDLIPYEHNPRQMTEKQNEDLKKSLEKFDLAEIPAVNTDNVILAGHQRLRIMQLLGRGGEEIDVRVPDRLLTEDEVKEYNIRSNKNIGEWDFDELANSFDLNDLRDWGFDEKDFKMDKEIEEDIVPDISEDEPKTKVGDIYKLGNHRLMCGDATKMDDVEKLMDGEKGDMVFTDPPYNIDYEGKTKKRLKIANDKFTGDQFYQFLLDSFINYFSFTKPGTAIYICHADMERINFQNALQNSGYEQKQNIIWAKDSMVLGRQDYHWQHEPILYGWKSDSGKHKWDSDRKQTTLWQVKRPMQSKEHPTMKPVELCAKAINNSSREGEIVLDLFGGSGSTLIACEQLNRKCFIMELDAKYCDVIVKRWEQFTGELAEKL